MIFTEFDSIANGGDIFLGYTPKILKEEDINNRAIEYSLLIQFNIDVFDPLGLRVRIQQPLNKKFSPIL